jgi:hypothetical protein
MNSPPSSPYKIQIGDVLESCQQLKSTFGTIFLNNRNGGKKQLFINVMKLLESGIKIEENLLKKINIFRYKSLDLDFLSMSCKTCIKK